MTGLMKLLRWAGGRQTGPQNLLTVSAETAVRFNDGYNNFSESDGVCHVTGTSRGGYKATVKTNTSYTFSFETDGPDNGLAIRVWVGPTDNSCGTLIVNDSEHRSATFTVTDEEDKNVTIVCGFYCTSEFAAGSPTISNWELHKA